MKAFRDRYVLAATPLESRLRATLFRYVRNKSDVEDVLQLTYVRLIEAGESPMEEVRNMPAFIFATSYNVALNFIRSRGRAVPAGLIAELERVSDGASVEELVSTQQEIDLFAAAIEQLSEQCRRVYTLRKVEGFSQEEIAEKLGISEATVHQHVSKAQAACLEALVIGEVSEGFLSLLFRRRMRRKREERT